MPSDPAEAVALARYRVIAEAADERLTSAERGRLVRELAARLHQFPDGSRREVSRATLDRWIRAWRAEGLEGCALSPAALERTCAVLGIRLVHSRPYAPY